MTALNQAAGPVGGASSTNNGGFRTDNLSNRQQLNTYIYDYFLKNEHYGLARALQKELSIYASPSLGKRDVNGIDDSMETDSKEDSQVRPDDLPLPTILDNTEGSFLYDWWCQFWDIWCAHRRKVTAGPVPTQYLAHAQQASRLKQDQQRRMLSETNMMPQQYRTMMQGMQPNGIVLSTEMQKRAIANNRTANPQLQQMKSLQQQQMMQRDGSGMDIGQRAQSPLDAAPSPKRQRLEGAGLVGQALGPAGRGQPIAIQGQVVGVSGPGQNHPLLIQNGINPGQLPQGQFEGFQGADPNAQAKVLEGMSAAGIPQSSPLSQQGPEAFFSGNPQAHVSQRMQGAPMQAEAGTHALQDYQMQLLLLEQQNRKRLMMARQEHDPSHGGGPSSVGQPGFGAAMSPSQSRAGGPSPSPNEQVKRGTPKMGQTGLPQSPLPEQARGSPVPNFDGSHVPHGAIAAPFFPQMAGNPAMMRPPSSHPGIGPQLNQQQYEAFVRQQGGRVPNGFWQQQMLQQQQQHAQAQAQAQQQQSQQAQHAQAQAQAHAQAHAQAKAQAQAQAQQHQQQGQGQPQAQNQGQQPPQVGTPQQRNTAMPPPPAPPATGDQGKTQPSSPAQQTTQPPTPSQTSKPNPKGKKDAKDTRKKPARKSTAGATATPASEAEPPTPTPSTPITPIHPNSFNTQKNGVSQPGSAQNQVPATVTTASAPVNQVESNPAPFGNIEGADLSLDFATLESSDVLEGFDFDSLLNNPDDNSSGPNWDLVGFTNSDTVEAGMGEI